MKRFPFKLLGKEIDIEEAGELEEWKTTESVDPKTWEFEYESMCEVCKMHKATQRLQTGEWSSKLICNICKSNYDLFMSD